MMITSCRSNGSVSSHHRGVRPPACCWLRLATAKTRRAHCPRNIRYMSGCPPTVSFPVRGSEPPCSIWFIGPTQVHIPNRITCDTAFLFVCFYTDRPRLSASSISLRRALPIQCWRRGLIKTSFCEPSVLLEFRAPKSRADINSMSGWTDRRPRDHSSSSRRRRTGGRASGWTIADFGCDSRTW